MPNHLAMKVLSYACPAMLVEVYADAYPLERVIVPDRLQSYLYRDSGPRPETPISRSPTGKGRALFL